MKLVPGKLIKSGQYTNIAGTLSLEHTVGGVIVSIRRVFGGNRKVEINIEQTDALKLIKWVDENRAMIEKLAG